MLSINEFREILDYFEKPWKGYRKVRRGIIRKISRHMNSLNCRTVHEYLCIIARCEAERVECEMNLGVTISRFFRDRQLWEYLQTKAIPDLTSMHHDGVRVWCAGCASGEEPYSLMIIGDHADLPIPLKILATDIKSDCLERARRGVYRKSSLRECDEHMLNNYFSRKGPGDDYTVDRRLREHITWLQHNLLHAPPNGPFELIFLRNSLLTYYQGAQLDRAFRQVVTALRPNGYLVIGSHEKLPHSKYQFIREPDCPLAYRLVPDLPDKVPVGTR